MPRRRPWRPAIRRRGSTATGFRPPATVHLTRPRAARTSPSRCYCTIGARLAPSGGAVLTSFAQWLTGGLAVLTGTVGVFGATSGDLGRVARNHPVLFAVLLATALLAITLGVIVAATNIPDVVLFPAAVALSVVTVWFTVLVATDESAKEGPAVAGALAATKDQLGITGTVRAGGLKSGEHMLVQVDGWRATTKKRVVLYRALIGPDADGKVDATISTVATTGRYDKIIVAGAVREKVKKSDERAAAIQLCNTTVPFRGCAVLTVPQVGSTSAKSVRQTKKHRRRG